MTAYGNNDHARDLSSSGRRLALSALVVALHVVFIGGPWLWMELSGKFSKPKENRFKVKLGSTEPSHAPIVGPPEQTRPTPHPPSPAPAPAPPPEPTPQPRPRPKLPPEPKPQPRPKPKTKPKPKARPKPKAKPKQPPKTAVKPPPEPPATTRPRRSSSARNSAANSRSDADRKNAKPKDDGVFNDGGNNKFNPNVRIGSRNAGQVKGKWDNRTPQGGANKDEERYQASLTAFVYDRWTPAEQVFWQNGKPPIGVVELTIAADGRVLSAKLETPSGNARMDASIRQMIKVLDRVPRPPFAPYSILVELNPK